MICSKKSEGIGAESQTDREKAKRQLAEHAVIVCGRSACVDALGGRAWMQCVRVCGYPGCNVQLYQ